MPTSNQLPGTSNYTLWHHLAMVIISDVIFMWLFTASLGVIGGLVLFNLTDSAFFKIAVGLPLIMVFSGVGLFKIHEIILVLIKPKRLEAICRFCR